jgi:tRNA(His) 5'-end guanylyltransferase
MLPRRTYTIIRLDGKAFHTYTRGLKKPFDRELFEDIDNAIIAMLPEVQGSVFAYTQSDEISILLTDFATPQTSAWFDGLLQKMASVSASVITAEFNQVRFNRCLTPEHRYDVNAKGFSLAYFDARVFTIPDRIEVMNYFIWRNQDCSRNSVSMVAQANFSHKELQGKSTTEMHEMLHAKKVNWATDYTDREKNGALIVKESYTVAGSVADVANFKVVPQNVERTRWVSKGAWKFTEDKEKLLAMIPTYSA